MNIFKMTLIVLLLLIGSNVFTENLITNSGFEDIIDNEPAFWAKDAWKLDSGESAFYLDNEIVFSGNHSVVIHNKVTNDARLVQGLTVKPSTYYLLSCWVRAENCGPRRGANIGVIDPQIFKSSKDLHDTKGNWEKLTFCVKTAPQQVIMSVCVRIGVFGNDNTGKAWFDNFTVEETSDSEYIAQAVDLPSTVSTMAEEAKPRSTSNSWGTGILVILGIIAVFSVLGFIAYFVFIRPKSNHHLPLMNKYESQLSKLTGLDIVLCLSLTLIYAVIALNNLGSLTAPQTYWKSSRTTEGCVVDFGEPKNIDQIYYWEGLPMGSMTHGVYLTFSSIDGENWESLVKLDPATQSYWYSKKVDVKARYVRILAETAGALLNEVVFIDSINSEVIPIKAVRVAKGSSNLKAYKRLFDEQDTLPYMSGNLIRPELFNGMTPGYDEQYHGRTAFENTIFKEPYENTHPPLGKLFIALGILIFGMNPFGWRVMGALFGIIMVPLMYVFGKELFRKTELALASALLMALDFMHFTQSRVSVIDVYGVFFIIFMYYFMLRYYRLSFFKTEFRKTLWPLLFSGIACGLGAASKWIAIYAFIGLAILFFISLGKKIMEYLSYKKALKSKSLKNKDDRMQIETIIKAFPKFIIRTLLFCCVVFILIPTAIYVASYMPILMSPDIDFDWNYIIDNNTGMFEYHSDVKESHPFATSWDEWPLMIRPFLYFTGDDLAADQRQVLASFGNPAVWWGGSALSLIVIIMAIAALFIRIGKTFSLGKISPLAIYSQKQGKSNERFFILVALATQYLPWIISPRTLTYIYHYFASIPFVIFAAIYFFNYLAKKLSLIIQKLKNHFEESLEDNLQESAVISSEHSFLNKFPWKKYVFQAPLWLFVLWALICFILFFPIISGTITTNEHVNSLAWLKTWPW